jgi:carbamoyl-phosphate synthase small subunit
VLAQAKQASRERDLVQSVTRNGRTVSSGDRGRVAVVDFGAKQSIVESVKALGAETVVFDASFTPGDVLSGAFDMVVLSNGPGDPEDVPAAIDAVRQLLGQVPLLGICLGHQITALAAGGRTFKLKFGHRGANQPVVCHRTRRVFMTSQNHGYAVSEDIAQLPGVTITFTNANDGTVEGFCDANRMVECVQFHPEASPGPHDTSFVFRDFFNRVKGWKHAQA